MKTKQLAAGIAIAFLTMVATPAMAQAELTGDPALACQAILCLSTGQPPNECTPPLVKYFNIVKRFWSDTLNARIDFLSLCPVVGADSSMKNLVNDIANGAGRCDTVTLNSTLLLRLGGAESGTVSIVSNQMPAYCTSYMTNPLTDLKASLPVYVGTPENGGFWTDPANYQQALAQYNAALEAKRRLMSSGYNGGGG